MRRGLIIGTGFWLIGVVVLRIWGSDLIGGSGRTFFWTLMIGAAIAAAAALLAVRIACPPTKVARFAGGLAIPGLLGHSASIIAFCDVFPTMSSTLADLLGAFFLWIYGIVLATVLLYGDKLVKTQ